MHEIIQVTMYPGATLTDNWLQRPRLYILSRKKMLLVPAPRR